MKSGPHSPFLAFLSTPGLATVVVLAITAACAAVPAVDLQSPAVEEALDSIEPEALGAHMRFLADDLLEGRGTGSRGYDLAARYVATRFEAIGLEPAGVGGTWFQSVPMRKAELVPAASGVSLQSRGQIIQLGLERDFVMGGDPYRTAADLTADVVFVGYGITAPELNYDDFAQVDARGKIVAVLTGAPPRFPHTLRAHYSNSRVKEANIAAHGAVGVLSIRTPVDERRSPWERFVRQSRFPSMRWVDARGMPDGVQPRLQCTATLSRSGAQALFQGASRSLDWIFRTAEQGTTQGMALPVRAQLRRQSRHETVSSPNVCGLLPGSDPSLKGDAVIFSAHLDHLGIGTPAAGDSIYNGAYDNATGVAALIEVAAAFARSHPRPRRSLLFLAVTGEERGLQGSGYFARQPTPSTGRMVANLNLDMYVMVGKLQRLVAYGGEHSSLGEVAQRAARRLGLSVIPDPSPEEVIFVRSDQYSFVREGVPSLFLVGRPGVAEGSAFGDWLRTNYHSPQDDLSQPLDLESLAEFARVHWLAGHIVANQSARPTWKPKDFFGDTFGKKRRIAAPRP
jgi:hypothetical protein